MAKLSSSEYPSNASSPAGMEVRKTVYEPTKGAHVLRTRVVANEKDKSPPDRLMQLVEYLLTLDSKDFTGYIKINYTQGSIGRVERFEEILRKRNCQDNL